MTDSLVNKNIKTLCKENHIPLAEMEKKMGVSTGYLSRRKNLSAQAVLIAAETLNVNMEDLMKEDFTEALMVAEHLDNILSEIGLICKKISKDDLMKELIVMLNDVYE